MAAGAPHGHRDQPRARRSRWITLNPARALGIERSDRLARAGKMADVVVWSGDPFSVYSRAEKVYIDGALIYDRERPARASRRTDFELGPSEPGRPEEGGR